MRSEKSILPSVKQDSKTTKEVSLAEVRPESDENSNVLRGKQQIAKQSREIDKNLKHPHLEVEANDFVSKTENEATLSGTLPPCQQKVLKIILQRMMVRNTLFMSIMVDTI